MRRINFYTTESGDKPVQDFLDSLEDKQVEKILWVLKLVREFDRVPRQYFQKLINTDDLWEVRATRGGNIFRLIGFFDGNKLIILTNGFQKKTQKTPKKEIALAEKRKKNYLARKENG
ncbi:MAG: type II toxin-antitoxin system RelE/ParE family toxin [Desulfobulbaceae bacterium]|nr:type II toxin-antitoxin system RelE/ParE family toxin [Desulfobulbaceae bacterium]